MRVDKILQSYSFNQQLVGTVPNLPQLKILLLKKALSRRISNCVGNQFHGAESFLKAESRSANQEIPHLLPKSTTHYQFTTSSYTLSRDR
jgi:hypothetical protein